MHGPRAGVGAEALSGLDKAAGQEQPGRARASAGHDSTPPLVNRASNSNSPYIRAHADSPVKWQLLDGEAIERAKRENKLVFLNVGFRACHYCRLTTQDSFSNPSVASLLNKSFVPVMVDREERPDIDTIYMNYIQAVNWVGGWPINVFLTPELEPVFGGTYWPGPGVELPSGEDISEEGRLDFLVILERMEKVWGEQEARCRKEAKEILSQLQVFAAEGTLGARGIDAPAAAASSSPAVPADAANSGGGSASITNLGAARSASTSQLDPDLDLDQLEEAFTHLATSFDAVNGGFGAEPKFPTPARLSFLLRLASFPPAVADVVGNDEVRHATLMALHSLRKIRDGGLRDHVGAGFARYSVTADWALPHFEKMTADNAQLLAVYLDAWLSHAKTAGALAEEDEFADVVLELADYLTSPPILRPGGGFANSEAADSFYRRGDRHMREGAYYLWTRREFNAVVGDASAVAAAHWNVLEHGNVPRHHDPSDEFLNQNVLRVAKGVPDLSRQFGIPADEVEKMISSARRRLREHRERERPRPETDGKVVASCNGMVIAALARTAAAVRELAPRRSARYLAAATEAARLVRGKLWAPEAKTLYRVFYEGRSETRGFADDYAFMIEGLLELYEVSGEEEWLRWAVELQESQISLFYDPPMVDPEAAAQPAEAVPTAGPAAEAAPGPRRSSSGGFYSTEEPSAFTILRLKDGMDTAQPSTNATAAANLFRLAAVLGDEAYADRARETITAFEAEVLQYPWLFLGLLSGVVAARLGARALAVVGEGEAAGSILRRPRAEPRGLARVKGPAGGAQWLLERNEPLRALVDAGGKGLFELKGGKYEAGGEAA